MNPRSSLPPFTSITFLSVAHDGSELSGWLNQKPGVRVTQPLLQLPSGTPQPHTPGVVLFGSVGQPSWESGVPSWSVSVSGTPQPHAPGAVLFGSLGQASWQSGVPSPSLSIKQFGLQSRMSGWPQPQVPGATLFGSLGQPS